MPKTYQSALRYWTVCKQYCDALWESSERDVSFYEDSRRDNKPNASDRNRTGSLPEGGIHCTEAAGASVSICLEDAGGWCGGDAEVPDVMTEPFDASIGCSYATGDAEVPLDNDAPLNLPARLDAPEAAHTPERGGLNRVPENHYETTRRSILKNIWDGYACLKADCEKQRAQIVEVKRGLREIRRRVSSVRKRYERAAPKREKNRKGYIV